MREYHPLAAGQLLFYNNRQFESIDPWHVEIRNHRSRLLRSTKHESALAVVCGICFIAEVPKLFTELIGYCALIIYYHNFQSFAQSHLSHLLLWRSAPPEPETV